MRLTIRQTQIHAGRSPAFRARSRHGLPLHRIGLHRPYIHMPHCQRGFTLIELIMTMVIVGILAAVAIPRFFDTNVFQSRGAADQVKAALRYGQKVAIAQHRPVSVAVSQGSPPDCGAALVSGNVNCVIPVAVASQTFWFNALGRLSDSAGAAITVNGSIAVGTAPNVTLIDIDAETGYVHSP